MTPTVHIRWLIRRDMPEVLAIEDACFLWDGWRERDWLSKLRQRNCIAVVAEVGHTHGCNVVGYLAYELHQSRCRQRRHFEMINLAVHPDHQRRGIGTALVRHLIGKCENGKSAYHAVSLRVSELNLGAQLFFAGLGFRGLGVEHGYWATSDEDAYVLQFSGKKPSGERTVAQ